MYFEWLNKYKYANYLLIVIVASALFLPYLGSTHLFDWDEINFAESAREMIATGNYTRVQINYKPFWEKPPLFFWLQVASMKIFGINELAARLPNAICGIITLCWIFYIGQKHFSIALARTWVIVVVGSFLPHFYFKSGIIDPWFNLFIFSSLYFVYLFLLQQSFKNILLAGLLAGLAILTKGPVALLLIVLVMLAYSIIKKDYRLLKIKYLFTFFMSTATVSSLWFGFELWKNGTWFINEFIQYHIRLFTTKDSGHGGPFFYHALVLLLGCFPASVFALNKLWRSFENHNDSQKLFSLFMQLLFWVVLIVFSLVKTKIVHYSSLCYLPLTFLAAAAIQEITVSKKIYKLLLIIGLFLGILLSILPIVGNHVELLEPYIKDPFGKANLTVKVDWPLWLCIPGVLYLVAIIYAYFSKRVIFTFAATAFIIFSCMIFFVPRIERYSQGSAIDFYKSMQGKDVYVEVSGFKSYAQYFYTQKQPCIDSTCNNKEALLRNKISKPVYIVTKIHKAQAFHEQHPEFTKLYEKGGFVFFEKSQ